MKFAVIINPHSGSNSKYSTKIVKARFEEVGGKVFLTEKAGHATQLAEQAIKNGAKQVIAVGGDGTLHEVLQAVAPHRDVTLGVIPMGTCNDFSRLLEYPQDFEEVIDMLIEGCSREIDIFKITGACNSWGLLAFAGGFVGHVSGDNIPQKDKKILGPLAYIKHGIRLIPKLKEQNFQIEMDGKKQSIQGHTIIVANAPYLGCGTPIAPTATIDDGLLHVIVISGSGPLDVAKLIPQLLAGRHYENEKIWKHTCKSIRIKAEKPIAGLLDGESVGPGEFKIKMDKEKISVLCPNLNN